jgi:hypothetical protein
MITRPPTRVQDESGHIDIKFQDGPVPKMGVNGTTIEAILAILIRRLELFQEGSLACEENSRALNGLRDAEEALYDRAERRRAAGIEGTYEEMP